MVRPCFAFPHMLPFTKEDPMSRRKGKTISFDAMVKFFMQNYDIPTKKDVDKLMAKLDRLENLIKMSAVRAHNLRAQSDAPKPY